MGIKFFFVFPQEKLDFFVVVCLFAVVARTRLDPLLGVFLFGRPVEIDYLPTAKAKRFPYSIRLVAARQPTGIPLSNGNNRTSSVVLTSKKGVQRGINLGELF